MTPVRHNILRRTRLAWLLLAVATCAALLAPALAAAASTESLAVQSVDTAAWPKVTMRVVLPTSMLAGTQLTSSDFSVTENGARIGDVKAAQVPAQQRALDVYLVLDTSGSMEGQQLYEAKSAATRFLSELGANDRVGLVTFDNPPSLVASLTTDRATVLTAVEGMIAKRRTALYDAIAVALAQLSTDNVGNDRAIVVLSDGADTESGHTLDTIAALVADSDIPVYAVALGDEAGTSALETVVRASDGRLFTAADAGDLSSVFSGIARQLTSPYDVTFTSLRPRATELELTLVASSGVARGAVTVAVPNPDQLVPEPPVTTPEPVPSRLWPLGIAVLGFLAISAIVFALLMLLRPEPNAIGQLKYFEQYRAAGRHAPGSGTEIDPESVRGRVVGLASLVAARGGFDTAIRQALERAGLPLRPVEYMILHSGTVLIAGGIVQIISRSILMTTLAVILLALGPVLALTVLADRRSNAFQEQLPDVLNLLASSLRAGWGLQQAVGVVVTELGPPAAPEFERVVTEARLGLPLEDALEKMAVRMESEDFRWAVTAIAIQREVGGNLAEVLDMVASTIRERAMLRRTIDSLTAEGRLSAVILIALPFVEAAAMWVLNPGYFAPLIQSPYGIATALFGLALLGVGIVWLRNVVKIEV